jgi:hypothetical protein
MSKFEAVEYGAQVDDLAGAGIAARQETIPVKESSNFLGF